MESLLSWVVVSLHGSDRALQEETAGWEESSQASKAAREREMEERGGVGSAAVPQDYHRPD